MSVCVCACAYNFICVKIVENKKQRENKLYINMCGCRKGRIKDVNKRKKEDDIRTFWRGILFGSFCILFVNFCSFLLLLL